MVKQILKKKLAAHGEDPDFVDFYCYKEDKWLQNAGLEEKLIAVFGSVDNALKAFDTYAKEEG